MDNNEALAILPNLIGFAVIAWVAFKVHTGKETEHRMAMSICFAFVAIDSLVLLGEKLSPDIGITHSIVLMEYICESIVLSSLLVFVLQYLGLGRLVNFRNLVLMISPGVLVVLLNATNQWHHLFYISSVVVEKHSLFAFEAEYGPLFLIWMGYFLGTVAVSMMLIVRAFGEVPEGHKGGIWSLLVAMLIIVITGVLYVFSPRDDPVVDIMSIGLTLSALTIFIGQRHLDFTDLKIIRFKEALGDMDDAVMIMDSTMQLDYVNKSGQRLLSENSEFIWERIAARGLKIPIGSNKWETVLNLDGAPRHFILTTSDIMRDRGSIGAVLVFHDITLRKGLENRLTQANKGLSTLNQIIRHDTRNDLLSFWGYLELLQATDLNARQKELVDKMVERAKSAEGHLTLAKEKQSAGDRTTIWQGVQATIDRAVGQVDMGSVTLDSNVQGMMILADPLLQNVFHCLADNTMRHGGEVRKIVVRGEETKTGLSIIWEDDGVGVPPEQKQMIFIEGFGQNTGEGLFLTREILSMSGFSITEEGEPGKGARFVIRIPSGWYAWQRTIAP